MSTLLGSTAHPTGWYAWRDAALKNDLAIKLTLPAGGPWVISKVGVWAAAVTGATNAYVVVWRDSDGAVLGKSALFSMAAHAFGSGNSDKHEANLATPVTVAGGTTVKVGLSRDPAGSHQFDSDAAGTTYEQTDTGAYPSALSAPTTYGHKMGAWLYYDLDNQAPRAPTLSSPVGGTKTDDSTPDLAFVGSDPDAGDTQTSYDLQVSTDASFASATHWNIAAQTTGQVGFNVTRTYAGAALTPGVTYYWRARTTDNHGSTGAWSATGSFKYNSTPNAPSLVAPSNGYRDITAVPTFMFSHDDPDAGDTLISYDLQVSTDGTFASVTHWNVVNGTDGIVDDSVSTNYAGTALTRGATYYWRVRTKDQGGLLGPWSAVWSFKHNALPTISGRVPGASALAVIHNIASSLALWTGSEARPQVKFTPADADGDTLTKYTIRIYDAAVAGNKVYDSGAVNLSMPSGVQVTVDVPFGIANATERWWTVMVYDGYEWMVESARTAFKMRWAQGLYEFDTGASSSQWEFATGTSTGTVVVLFRSATSAGGNAATGKSAFFGAITAVPKQRWMQWLVRLSGAGTLASGTLTYRGTSPVPDGWVVT